jgi:hypothetical protein
MPPQANLCSMLVDLKREVYVYRQDVHAEKTDLCDVVDARISQIVKQLISTPYCNNFSFNIDKPPELDTFDRVALEQMEASDDVCAA